MFFPRFSVYAFLAALSLSGSSIQAMEATITITQPQTNSALLNQAVQEVKEFIDSQAGFAEDRVEYYKDHLVKLEALKAQQRNYQSIPGIFDLEKYYRANLPVTQSNLESALSYKDAINKYVALKMEDISFSPEVGAQFKTFLFLNNYEQDWLEVADAKINLWRSHVDPKNEQALNSIFYEAYKSCGLQEKANEFSKVVFLANVFSSYLESYSSFLVSRHLRRSYGENMPSTKSEDWALLEVFDREKVEVSCTNFANILKPLGIIYKALQQLSRGRTPSYLIGDAGKKILEVSPILKSYLRGEDFADLHPDLFIQDAEKIEKLDIYVTNEVRERLSKIPRSMPSQQAASKPLSRQEQRALSRKKAKTKRDAPGNPTVTASPSTAAPQKKLPVSVPPQSLRTTPTKAKPKEAKVETAVQCLPSSTIVKATPLVHPSKTEPTTSSLQSTQDVSSSTETPVLKPKRWRGDIVVRKDKKSPLHQLMDTVDKVVPQKREKESSKSSDLVGEGTILRATALLDQYQLTRNDIQVIELLLDNKTHPNTITRKHFLHLLQSLKVVSTPTTGSIYNLYYLTPQGQNITKVMHIWDMLGRNMMKRARVVLREFGFLAEQ